MNEVSTVNNAMTFLFDGEDIRVVVGDQGEPWFVAKDVSQPLGYRMASDMTRNLDEDEKGTHLVRTLGGNQQMVVINESGLYSAILRSERPEAKRMKKWVTSEVLPSIRKTGSYSLQPKPMSQIEVLLASVQMLADVEKRTTQLQNSIAKHETKFKSIESDVEELKDTNLLKVCPSNAEPITEIRSRINKQYGLSANVVNKVMSDTPHAPRAYGYVINQHPDANGSTFSVYLKRDVSDVFSRFVKECIQVEGSTRYEHPFIESKFKLNK